MRLPVVAMALSLKRQPGDRLPRRACARPPPAGETSTASRLSCAARVLVAPLTPRPHAPPLCGRGHPAYVRVGSVRNWRGSMRATTACSITRPFAGSGATHVSLPRCWGCLDGWLRATAASGAVSACPGPAGNRANGPLPAPGAAAAVFVARRHTALRNHPRRPGLLGNPFGDTPAGNFIRLTVLREAGAACPVAPRTARIAASASSIGRSRCVPPCWPDQSAASKAGRLLLSGRLGEGMRATAFERAGPYTLPIAPQRNTGSPIRNCPCQIQLAAPAFIALRAPTRPAAAGGPPSP